MQSLKLPEFSDRELLFVVYEQGDEKDEGWAPSKVIGEVLGITHDHPAKCVGSRMAWLKRYGAVEGGSGKWRLTPVGEVMMKGELSKTQANALEGIQEKQALMLVRAVGRKYQGATSTTAHLMRREWVFNAAQRNGTAN